MATNKQCTTRLQKEYKSILKEPVPHISAHPMPTNLLEWHFVLQGDKDTDYAGGVYHGKIVFPPQYPFKPPSLSLYTPNGRFATNTKLCLSFTDHHPESWNPMWSVSTILTGLLSFMHDSQPTTGSISSSPEQKRRYAAESLAFNVKNPMFRKLFPEWVEEHQQRQEQPYEQQPPQQQEQQVQGDSAQPQQPQVQQQAQPAVVAQHSQPGHPAGAKGQAGQHSAAAGEAQQAGGEGAAPAGLKANSQNQPLAVARKQGAWSMGSSLCALAAVVLVVALVSGPILHLSTPEQAAGSS